MASKVKVGIHGASGRMGQQIINLIGSEYTDRAEVVATPKRGESIESLLKADAVIDFSLPEGTLPLVNALLQAKKAPALVVGTTGIKGSDKANMKKLAEKSPVFFASNYSTGIFLMQRILQFAQPAFEKLGYQPVLVDRHHKHKKDSPSGTALSLQRVISPMGPGNVPTHSMRLGDVVGDHEVSFYGKGDQLEITHRALDRSIFARGAIDVALWLAKSPKTEPRILGMEDYFSDTIDRANESN